MTIRNGDVAEGFKTSDVIIEGEAYVGGQEHFYLEMQSGIAVPSGEDDEITMLMATQFPNFIQVCFVMIVIATSLCLCVSMYTLLKCDASMPFLPDDITYVMIFYD